MIKGDADNTVSPFVTYGKLNVRKLLEAVCLEAVV